MIPLKAIIKLRESVKVDPKKNEKHFEAHQLNQETVYETVERDGFCDDVFSAIDAVEDKVVTNIYARCLMRVEEGYIPFITDYNDVTIDKKEVEEYVRLSWRKLNK